jgi:hypothetical protein
MTKVSNTNDESEMLDEYDFSKGVRGKYFHSITNNQGRKTAVLIYLNKYPKIWTDVLEKYGHLSSFQFLCNKQGEKNAVLLDFKEHQEIWEYMYDRMVADLISNK